MAEGARAATGAEVGVSVTGIGGPGRRQREKPVGLVYLHVSAPGVRARAGAARCPGSREVRESAATAALRRRALIRTDTFVTPARRCGAPRPLSYRQNIRS